MSLLNAFFDKVVLVRTYSAGVHFGKLIGTSDNGKMIKLLDSRRIWRWEGACSLSQIAMEGVKNPEKCKIAMEVKEIVLTEAIEIIPISEQALTNLNNVKVWKS